ncbi:hypothetical protein [Porticoccus sp.]
MSQEPVKAPKEFPIERLPCRGCTKSCPHLMFCDGKLWRMSPRESVSGKASVENPM